MLKKNNKTLNIIISIFIILQPILDLITSILIHHNVNLTIGMVIKSFFLLYIIYQVVFKYHNKKSLIVYLILFLYCIVYLFVNGLDLVNLKGLFRTIYFPTLLVSLYSLRDDIKISKAPLLISLFLYLIFIFVPTTIGIGYDSYAITKKGILGFFSSANEISGIISIITPIMLIYLKDLKNIFIKIILFIIYLIVILSIGTKTPLLSLIISIGLIYIWYMFKFFRDKKYNNIIISLLTILVCLIGLVLIIPKTVFYKNINTHIKYLKIDSVDDVVENPIIFDHFIFSERLTFLEGKKNIYDASSIKQKLFGIGYINDKEIKSIEIDYYDIYYSHGIIGALLIFIIYIYILINVVKSTKIITINRWAYSISLFLVILLSLFTGHIITAPTVSLIVCVIIVSLWNSKKKNLLFTSVNLDIGGIEKSLVNLLDNIDYKKYNVTLVLEEKRGILIDRINENVYIDEVKVANDENIIIRKSINLLRKINYIILNYDNYDFSCCYATYSLSSNLLARVSSKNNCIYIHSNYTQIYRDEDSLRKFFNIRHINEFNKIIFVSNEAREDLLKYYSSLRKKSYVYNNFIDVNMIKKQGEELIKEKRLKNKTLLVFVGRLEDASKKIKRAINLVKEIDTLELWIIGDGPDRGVYEDYTKNNQLTDRVKFMGSKLNPYPYMRESDYIILTSDYEGFPVIYLEAIALEKNIITTIPTSDDEIDIKDYAFVISKNKNTMVEEVKEILSKKSNNKYIDLNHIQKNRIKKLESIFDEVI